jgi:hypothetical protein
MVSYRGRREIPRIRCARRGRTSLSLKGCGICHLSEGAFFSFRISRNLIGVPSEAQTAANLSSVFKPTHDFIGSSRVGRTTGFATSRSSFRIVVAPVRPSSRQDDSATRATFGHRRTLLHVPSAEVRRFCHHRSSWNQTLVGQRSRLCE